MTPEAAARKFPFVKIAEDGVLEFYCDHSILSSLRTCEQYFVETHVRNVRGVARNWNFDFGTWLHTTLELFYHYEFKKFRRLIGADNDCQACGREWISHNPTPECEHFLPWDSIPKGKFIAYGSKLWDDMKMDYFQDKTKMFKTLDGQIGALKLLSDYWNVYGQGHERLRVIGIEVPFGRNKEFPIRDDASDWLSSKFAGPYRAYLTGRFDQLVEDGIGIAAFDHKSTAFFDGSEASKFSPHDGMQGYAGVAGHMAMQIAPEKATPRVIINHICLTDTTNKKPQDKHLLVADPLLRVYEPNTRFTRTTHTYTPSQIAEFKLRQAATFDALYQLIILERPAQWNTGNCNDMYHKECPFKGVHGLTPELREQVFNNQFTIVESWNPFYESKVEIL
jgi:hypothetical protein